MEYLPEYEGVYLEDSYILGLVAEGNNLRLPMEFALTIDHPHYAAPIAGEAHCFRKGSILIEEPKIMEWNAGTPSLARDAAGIFDFGRLELYRAGPTLFRVHTEWFDMTVDAKRLALVID